MRRAVLILAGLIALSGAAQLGNGTFVAAKAVVAQWLMERAWTRSQVEAAQIKPLPLGGARKRVGSPKKLGQAVCQVFWGCQGRFVAGSYFRVYEKVTPNPMLDSSKSSSAPFPSNSYS